MKYAIQYRMNFASVTDKREAGRILSRAGMNGIEAQLERPKDLYLIFADDETMQDAIDVLVTFFEPKGKK